MILLLTCRWLTRLSRCVRMHHVGDGHTITHTRARARYTHTHTITVMDTISDNDANISTPLLLFAHVPFTTTHTSTFDLCLFVCVLKGFWQRFPNRDAEGKIDFWPTQALETWECLNITCVALRTNHFLSLSAFSSISMVVSVYRGGFVGRTHG